MVRFSLSLQLCSIAEIYGGITTKITGRGRRKTNSIWTELCPRNTPTASVATNQQTARSPRVACHQPAEYVADEGPFPPPTLGNWIEGGGLQNIDSPCFQDHSLSHGLLSSRYQRGKWGWEHDDFAKFDATEAKRNEKKKKKRGGFMQIFSLMYVTKKYYFFPLVRALPHHAEGR